MKRHFYQVPAHVAAAEAAALFQYMATGEPEKTQFLDEKNQILFDSLENLMAQAGRVGTEQFCQYLTEMNLLDSVGGLAYVKKFLLAWNLPRCTHENSRFCLDRI